MPYQFPRLQRGIPSSTFPHVLIHFMHKANKNYHRPTLHLYRSLPFNASHRSSHSTSLHPTLLVLLDFGLAIWLSSLEVDVPDDDSHKRKTDDNEKERGEQRRVSVQCRRSCRREAQPFEGQTHCNERAAS